MGRTHEAVRIVFPRIVEAYLDAIRHHHKLLFFGNRGSAADAQHLATELVVQYQKDRAAIYALALTTDTSTLTAIGNDLGFDELFARQVAAVCCAGDVAIDYWWVMLVDDDGDGGADVNSSDMVLTIVS